MEEKLKKPEVPVQLLGANMGEPPQGYFSNELHQYIFLQYQEEYKNWMNQEQMITSNLK